MQEVRGSIPRISTNKQSKVIQKHPKARVKRAFLLAGCIDDKRVAILFSSFFLPDDGLLDGRMPAGE